MNEKRIMYAGAILAVLVLPSVSQAFAQYYPTGTDIREVYDNVNDGATKTEIAKGEGAFGSGTPYFAADGVVGSTVLTAGVFGGIATMFFIRGRKGKYAAQGRG